MGNDSDCDIDNDAGGPTKAPRVLGHGRVCRVHTAPAESRRCLQLQLPQDIPTLSPGSVPTSHADSNGGPTSSRAGSHRQREEVGRPSSHHTRRLTGPRYDRQLRLWGATGQQALEDSHILLINSGPGVAGVETLKNLVLPGIGQFTIQDSAVVSEADLGVNFFLEDQHLGGYRAEHTCNLLKELNPDVQGNYVTEVRVAKQSDWHTLTRSPAH
jgi:hypothetical protein